MLLTVAASRLGALTATRRFVDGDGDGVARMMVINEQESGKWEVAGGWTV